MSYQNTQDIYIIHIRIAFQLIINSNQTNCRNRNPHKHFPTSSLPEKFYNLRKLFYRYNQIILYHPSL
jgi:hypothetical protein